VWLVQWFVKKKEREKDAEIEEKLQVEIKVNVAMEAYREIRGIAPLILNLGSNWRRVVNYTSQLLPPPPSRKELRYSLTTRLSAPQSQSGTSWRRENPFLLSGFEPRTFQPVAKSVYRLRCFACNKNERRTLKKKEERKGEGKKETKREGTENEKVEKRGNEGEIRENKEKRKEENARFMC
jgi:hypothetical protein